MISTAAASGKSARLSRLPGKPCGPSTEPAPGKQRGVRIDNQTKMVRVTVGE